MSANRIPSANPDKWGPPPTARSRAAQGRSLQTRPDADQSERRADVSGHPVQAPGQGGRGETARGRDDARHRAAARRSTTAACAGDAAASCDGSAGEESSRKRQGRARARRAGRRGRESSCRSGAASTAWMKIALNNVSTRRRQACTVPPVRTRSPAPRPALRARQAGRASIESHTNRPMLPPPALAWPDRDGLRREGTLRTSSGPAAGSVRRNRARAVGRIRRG